MNNDRYRVLFEHSSDAHFILKDGIFVDCNDAALQMFACDSREDVIGKNPAVLSPELQPDGTPSAAKVEELQSIARRNGFHRFEFMHQTLAGEELPVSVTLNCVEFADGPAQISVVHDLREAKRLERELRSANERMSRDLEAAAAVQSALLPHVLPSVDGIELEWAFHPCDELAGDILNVFLLDPGHLAFYVLDVSGHGVASSLLSVTASHFLAPGRQGSLFRGGGADSSVVPSPTEIAGQLNARLHSRGGPVQFLTLFCGILDLETRDLRYTCAAHPGALRLAQDGEVSLLEHPGLPIGIVADVQYEEGTTQLRCGDRLYVFSDGIPEARAPNGEQYGTERLTESLVDLFQVDLRDSVDSLVGQVREWCAPNQPQDDISLVAIEVTP